MDSKLTVQVNGLKYAITTSEEPSYVRGLASEIDKVVTKLVRSNGISANQALLLASLSYLDSYKKSEEGADNLRKQITEYANEAAKARSELAEVRKELTKLQNNHGNHSKKGAHND